MPRLQEQAVNPTDSLAKERANAVELALTVLEHEARYSEFSDDDRWRLMVLGCSINDINLWVRRTPDPSDDDLAGLRFVATEIETGCTAYGETAALAISNYFLGGVTLK